MDSYRQGNNLQPDEKNSDEKVINKSQEEEKKESSCT